MPGTRRVWRGALIAAMISGVPAAVGAQVARGVVVDLGDTPVPGVVVQLLDSTRAVVARALTDERGEFRLLAPRDASYAIATLRIGFRPTLAGPFAMQRGEAVARRLTLSGLAVSLDTVRMAERSVCGRAGADSAMVTFAAWDQVRTALAAAELSMGATDVMATMVGYQRTLDPFGTRVRDQAFAVHTELVRQPWQSRPVAVLHRQGYVVTLGDSTEYNAPGLDMLASPTFVEDHCLRLVSPRDKSRLGIAFEPTRERRDIPEIRGTLWLDRASAQLRSLDYRYVNVSVDEDHSGTGGAMEFAPMTNGAWVITRWSVRMPVVERRTPVGGLGRRREATVPENVVVALAVQGGDLAIVRRGSDTLWKHAPVLLAGTVSDSASGRGVAGARLVLLGTTWQSASDASGRFAMAGVLPGEYALEVRTTGLDSLGAVHRTRAVVADGAPSVTVRVPSPQQLASALCGRRVGTGAAGPGIVVGTATVAGATQSPRHLKVTAEWTEVDTRPGAAAERSRRYLDAVSDTSGNFRLCGVPVGTDLVVSGASDEGTAAPIAVRMSEGTRLTRAELAIDPRAIAGAEFAGIVVDSAGQPIADAEVAITALQKSLLTTERGAFRLRAIAPGTYPVVVRKIGWGPLSVSLAFGANQTVEHRVVLTRVTVLEEVTVTAASNIPWKREFEENRRLGLGHFLTRDDLAKKEGQTMTAIMQQMPAADVMLGHADHAWLTSRHGIRGVFFAPNSQDSLFGAIPGCYAQVYLDNLPLFTTRDQEPLFDLSSISPDRIEAIEYYEGPAQTPLKYTGRNSSCGVLVIHRRVSR